MKNFFYILLLFLIPAFNIFSQNANECNKAKSDNFVSKGDAFLNQKNPNFNEALNNYMAAMVACRDNMPQIQKKIVAMFDKINKLKDQAIASESKAQALANGVTELLIQQIGKKLKSEQLYDYYKQQADSCFNAGNYKLCIDHCNAAKIMAQPDQKIQAVTNKKANAETFMKDTKTADSLFLAMKYDEAEKKYLSVIDRNKTDKQAKEMLSIISPIYDLVTVHGGTFYLGGDTTKTFMKTKLKTFEMTKYEITNAQFAKFLNQYGSTKVKTGKYAGQNMISENDIKLKKENGIWLPIEEYKNHPVVNVNWYGALAFCEHYCGSLPTEAQWEYAAKGGIWNEKFEYAGSDDVDSVAWYDKNSKSSTHPVGKLKPNVLGLYDMSGNVWEWCKSMYVSDYNENYYEKVDEFDMGSGRVLRSGSWYNSAEDCRTGDRYRSSPSSEWNFLGLRLVLCP